VNLIDLVKLSLNRQTAKVLFFLAVCAHLPLLQRNPPHAGPAGLSFS
jgi:hypothetical protein